MNYNKLTCEDARILIMGLMDGELTPVQQESVKKHIDSCRSCREQFELFSKLKEETLNMKLKPLPEMYWDEYWTHVYNKIERRAGWIFISIGLILIVSFGFYEFVKDFLMNSTQPLILRAGVSVLGIGIIITGISVLREKLMVRKKDKYRSILR